MKMTSYLKRDVGNDSSFPLAPSSFVLYIRLSSLIPQCIPTFKQTCHQTSGLSGDRIETHASAERDTIPPYISRKVGKATTIWYLVSAQVLGLSTAATWLLQTPVFAGLLRETRRTLVLKNGSLNRL